MAHMGLGKIRKLDRTSGTGVEPSLLAAYMTLPAEAVTELYGIETSV